jgi:predicted hotdog family 3-hydroxylacyl-ACP dehydratase
VTGAAFPAIEEILPHRGDMLLLDRITEATAERLCAQAEARADAWYADAEGSMPAWITIELMAQAIAAFVGLEHRRHGRPIKIGFLLGTRKFSCTVPAIAPGTVLDVVANLAYREPEGLGAFDCYIMAGDARVAEATIKVYEPDDPTRFLAGEEP